MHLGSAARQIGREIARQPAPLVVPQPRHGRAKRRLRGRLQAETTAAVVYRAARVGLVADLSLPCPAGADAAAPDWHWTVQVCRIQAERGDQACAQPGLLEAGP